MKQKTLFVAATAAEAKAAAGEPCDLSELRAWLAGQALAGIGTWLPYPRDAVLDDPRCDLTKPEAQAVRARWAVGQADAMLVALGLRPEPQP